MSPSGSISLVQKDQIKITPTSLQVLLYIARNFLGNKTFAKLCKIQNLYIINCNVLPIVLCRVMQLLSFIHTLRSWRSLKVNSSVTWYNSNYFTQMQV